MTFYPRGLLVFILFAGVLAVALIPRWGVLAAAACVLVELFLLFGVSGLGRGRSAR
jgi:hypothetical protein